MNTQSIFLGKQIMNVHGRCYKVLPFMPLVTATFVPR